MAVSHLWDALEKCHKGISGLFVKFRGGPIRALGTAQQEPEGWPNKGPGEGPQGPWGWPKKGPQGPAQ